MLIETKFNFNDDVYPISLKHETKWIPCKLCNSRGFITLADGEEVDCPKCYGTKGEKKYMPQKWMIDYEHIGKIKNIKFDLYNNKKHGQSKKDYMLDSTGVGSGTLWPEENLFKTDKEAEIECDKRNSIYKLG